MGVLQDGWEVQYEGFGTREVSWESLLSWIYRMWACGGIGPLAETCRLSRRSVVYFQSRGFTAAEMSYVKSHGPPLGNFRESRKMESAVNFQKKNVENGRRKQSDAELTESPALCALCL